MKKLFVYKKYTCHRFDEATNEIVFYYQIIANRPMTPTEQKQYTRLHIASVILYVLSLLSAVAGLSFIILTKDVLPVWYCGVGIACILLCALPLYFAQQYGDDAEYLKEKEFLKTGFEDEDATYESLENYVKECAKVWREAHPLEEKIRIAKETGNCVDIAAVMKYCGEDLVDRIKH